MKKSELKEIIKQSMSELKSPEYLALMKKADDTSLPYSERDKFRNQAWDLKRTDTGAMSAGEEEMIDKYEEEEANKHALDSENPLEETKGTAITDYKVGDILSFKDGEDWKVTRIKDKVGKLVIKPHNEKAKEGNVSLNIDVDLAYLKQHLKTESLNEVINKTDRIVESWSKKKILKEADLSQANFNDLHQVVKNIAHVNEIGMEEAAMQAIEYIAEQFDVPVDFKDFN